MTMFKLFYLLPIDVSTERLKWRTKPDTMAEQLVVSARYQ